MGISRSQCRLATSACERGLVNSTCCVQFEVGSILSCSQGHVLGPGENRAPREPRSLSLSTLVAGAFPACWSSEGSRLG